MSKMTAVEWLFEQLPFETRSSRYAFDALQVAKEMEKEQIIDAVTYGNRQEIYDATETIGNQYYNQTYKGGENV